MRGTSLQHLWLASQTIWFLVLSGVCKSQLLNFICPAFSLSFIAHEWGVTHLPFFYLPRNSCAAALAIQAMPGRQRKEDKVTDAAACHCKETIPLAVPSWTLYYAWLWDNSNNDVSDGIPGIHRYFSSWLNNSLIGPSCCMLLHLKLSYPSRYCV